MPTDRERPAVVSKRLRMLAVALGLGIPVVSGACLISNQVWLTDTVGRLFFPGLVVSLYLLRSFSISSLIMAFLVNVMAYTVGIFLVVRWRAGRRG